jgi:hypothetical protein
MWLLLLMFLVMPLEQNPRMYLAPSLLGVIPDFTVIKLLALLGLGWALLRMMTGGLPEGLLESRQAKLFVVFFTGVILAGLINGSGTLAFTRYLGFLMFLPFVLVAVRGHEDLRKAVYLMPLSLALAFPYAFYQMTKYDVRLGINLYESNYFAAHLTLMTPLALAIAFQQTVGWKKAAWVGVAMVLITALFFTGSRGGFLGLLVAGALFVYRKRGAGAAIGLTAVLVLAMIPTTVGTRLLASVFPAAEVLEEGELYGLERSNEAHMALLWAALRMIADEPFTGVGPNRFKVLSSLYSDIPLNLIAHNTYLELAAEMGLPVLAIFVAVIATVFGTLGRATRLSGGVAQRELALWAEGLRSGLIGFLVAGTFISAQYEKWLWVTVFLSVTVARLCAHYERAAVPAPAPAPADPEPGWHRAPAPGS